MRVTESASGSEVQLRRGERLEISLEENPSTGFLWLVASDGAPVVKLERHEFVPGAQVPGSPGRHEWVFVAEQPGRAAIELRHRKPFETAEPARRFTLIVRS